MNELVVIAEGETEQTFVRDLLAGHLALHGTSAWAVLSGKKRNRGGVQNWATTQQDIVRTLKEGRYCTTMVDYYAMPEEWPGRVNAKSMPWSERAAYVEQEIALRIPDAIGNRVNPKYFIPYVQLHEFEALAFADVNQLAGVLSPLSDHAPVRIERKLRDILEGAGHPEAINDGYETCPSRRISGVAKAYRKRVHGPIVTGRIGLDVLRERCGHFASWLTRLETLGAT